MPPVKLHAVISCSSEDPNNPAENLIKSDKTKKWKSSAWENSVSVVLELEKATRISAIDIGNENSAFVEILVGRSSAPNADFQVLLVASSFMSPLESRNGSNLNRVRMFTGDQLCKSATEQKWDRVKAVCTQPFNKHVRFGLSFITLHAPAFGDNLQHGVAKIGQFVVKECDNVIPVGSLFQKRKQLDNMQPLSGAAVIREASRQEALARAASKLAESDHCKADVSNGRGKVSHETTERTSGSNASNNKRENGNASFSEEKVKGEGKLPSNRKDKVTKGSKREYTNSASHSAEKKPRLEPEASAKLRKPFGKLLEGVTFAISGYQNPHRSDVRSFALQMGAKYHPDWNSNCTHLICAFAATPKFRQVKGRGKIVTKEWLEECYHKRKRVPWRRFALDKKDKSRNESEDEILELKDEAESIALKECEQSPSKSGSDTDDDIRRVQASGMCSEESCKSVACSNPYEDDTDVDSERDEAKDSAPDTSSLPLPPLPSLFDCKTFYLCKDLADNIRTLLKRYIVALKGKVVRDLSEEVQFAVANSRKSSKEVEKYPNVTVVRCGWVWACNDEGRLVPTSTYLL